MIALPAKPTGAELVNALEQRASELGIKPRELVRALSNFPDCWLKQTAEAQRPRAHTVDRVRALLTGEGIPVAVTEASPSTDVERGSAVLRQAIAQECKEREERLRKARQTGSTVNAVISIERPQPVVVRALQDGDRRPFARDRGPCPRCATRGDLGCAHQRPYHFGDVAA